MIEVKRYMILEDAQEYPQGVEHNQTSGIEVIASFQQLPAAIQYLENAKAKTEWRELYIVKEVIYMVDYKEFS